MLAVTLERCSVNAETAGGFAFGPCVADLRLPWERRYSAPVSPPRSESVAAFWRSWWNWAHPPGRQNPAVAPWGGPKDGSRAGRSAIRLSRGRPKSSRRQGEREFCEGLYIHPKTLVLRTQEHSDNLCGSDGLSGLGSGTPSRTNERFYASHLAKCILLIEPCAVTMLVW